MKKLLLSIALISPVAFGQNVNDNKVSFDYIQLPYFQIDPAYSMYDVIVEHGYQDANADSLSSYELNKKVAVDVFLDMLAAYERQTDSLDRIHYRQLAKWEEDVNAGKTQPNGQPLPKPIAPAYPPRPIYPVVEEPILHSQLADNIVTNGVDIEGFSKGMGGFQVTVKVLPLQNIQIKESKKGSGASTRYTYTCTYSLPVELTVASPTQGKLMQLRILEGSKSYKIGEYKSRAAYKLYMLDNEDQFHRNLEQTARSSAVAETNRYLNDQIGYVRRTRRAEIYSVKKFKNYDYSDVTNAYTKSVQALQMVALDRDRASAISKIDEALAAWNEIMQESNSFDNKARINGKVTAMIQCNMAELQLWKADFTNVDMNVNLAINNGGKFKRHAQREKGFYDDQKRRWKANY